MKKFIVLSIVLLMIAGFAITSSATVIEFELAEVFLVAGQNIDEVGKLTVVIEIEEGALMETGHLAVRYDTNFFGCAWKLLEAHLYVGTEEPEKSAPGRFPYGPESWNIYLQGDCFVEFHSIPLSDFITNFEEPNTLYIAAQVEVRKQMVDENEEPLFENDEPVYQEETAWADGEYEIRPGKNWAMYFSVEVPIEVPESE